MKVTATFQDDIVNIILEENGIATPKTLFLNDFLELLNSCKKQNHELVSIPELPVTYVAGEIEPSALKPTGTMAVFVKGQKQRMAYESEHDTIMVPFPSIILIFKVKKGLLMETFAYAVKEQSKNKITRNTLLFNYPYGNVSSYSGKVCWGLNRFNELKSFKELDMLAAKFITSPTNNDLYAMNSSTSLSISLTQLIKQQAKMDEFNNDILVDTGMTLNDALKK